MNDVDDADDWLWSRTSRDCWVWTGAVSKNGYGAVKFRGRQMGPHQAAFILTYGEPENDVLHRCGIRLCINPLHLYDGTDLENVADRIAHGRQAVLAGEKNSQARLTATQVRAIRDDRRPGSIAATEYGITPSTYYRIKRREAWAHIQ